MTTILITSLSVLFGSAAGYILYGRSTQQTLAEYQSAVNVKIVQTIRETERQYYSIDVDRLKEELASANIELAHRNKIIEEQNRQIHRLTELLDNGS